MLIRKGEIADLYEIHKMTENLHEEGIDEYGLGHTSQSAAVAIELFIRKHLGVVAVQDGEVIGCLGGFFTPYYFNQGSVIFQEILWYVRPDKRSTGAAMKLFYKAMELAKEQGATHIVMAHSGKVLSQKLSMVYGKLGFEVLEIHYIRGLA